MTKRRAPHQQIQDMKRRLKDLAQQARATAHRDDDAANQTQIRADQTVNSAFAINHGQQGASGAFSIQSGDTVHQGVLTPEGWVTRESGPDRT